MTLEPRPSQREMAEIKPYDSDHTALVHVLWEAERGGITISDADVLASHIIGSKWMQSRSCPRAVEYALIPSCLSHNRVQQGAP